MQRVTTVTLKPIMDRLTLPPVLDLDVRAALKRIQADAVAVMSLPQDIQTAVTLSKIAGLAERILGQT